MPLIECVPNVSEGRRDDAVARVAASIDGPGVALLDRSSDASHNRTVYTFVGEPDALQEAVMRLFDAALSSIDLRSHDGVHPRMGAVDVVPFVPLEAALMEDCVALARRTGALVAQRFGVPVFLYEEAAASPERRGLAEIRRGGVSGVALRMKRPEWRPDFGPATPHPTAGATAIGARSILIAYNVNLASNRLDVAKRIARSIRESGGGLKHVKAMGVHLESGVVQVSMNLTNFRETSIADVFDAVAAAAAADGVRVLESELVGLAPAAALPPDPRRRLKLREGDLDRVLDARLGRTVAV